MNAHQLPDEVGVDISTLEAVQSLFRGSPDPFALDCLANWIDVTVNSDTTLYALPKALGDLEANVVFPPILRAAEDRRLIAPVSDDCAADRMALSSNEIERTYIAFDSWASTNVWELKAWLHFTTSVRRINEGRLIDEGPVNRWVRNNFWNVRPKGWLRDNAAAHGLSSDRQLLAFDMAIRAAQYHIAFGQSRGYHPHPIRSLYVPGRPQVAPTHSWGWFVVDQIAESKARWDQKRLLDTLTDLRIEALAHGATVKALSAVPADERRERLNRAAVAAGLDILPDSFKKGLGIAEKTVGAGLEVVGQLSEIPFIGLAWVALQIPISSCR